MQFCERSQKSFAKSEGFSIKVWKWQKNFHYLKIFFPREIVFGFIDCKSGKHAKTFLPTVQKLLLQVRKKWKKETLIEKDFLYKTASGMIECSFDKRAFFSKKVWKWQNGSLNFRKKFRKMFLWTANMPLMERS